MSSWPGELNLGATKRVIRKDVREARHQLQYFVAGELKLSTTSASISGSFRSSASLVISSRPSVSRMREQQLTSTDPKCKATSCHITCNPDSLSLEGNSCDLWGQGPWRQTHTKPEVCEQNTCQRHHISKIMKIFIIWRSCAKKARKAQAELLQTRSDEKQHKCRYYGLASACSDAAAVTRSEHVVLVRQAATRKKTIHQSPNRFDLLYPQGSGWVSLWWESVQSGKVGRVLETTNNYRILNNM